MCERRSPPTHVRSRPVRRSLLTGESALKRPFGVWCVEKALQKEITSIKKQALAGWQTCLSQSCQKGDEDGRTLDSPPDEVSKLNDALEPHMRDETFLTKLPTQECRGTFASNAQGRRYGFKTFKDYFTPRQLVALATFGDLVQEARAKVLEHSGGDEKYADGVSTYLACAVSRCADFGSTLCVWSPAPKNELIVHALSRQGLPMTWDFAEGNPFSNSTGNWTGSVAWVTKSLEAVPAESIRGHVYQLDAASAFPDVKNPMVCTDPPYYDNIVYLRYIGLLLRVVETEPRDNIPCLVLDGPDSQGTGACSEPISVQWEQGRS